MKRLSALAAVFFLAVWTAPAQGPDSAYVRIYHLIQEADTLQEKGQTGQAVARYRQAQSDLVAFQKQHPSWHENIVKYRLEQLETETGVLRDYVAAQRAARCFAKASGKRGCPGICLRALRSMRERSLTCSTR